MKKGEKKNVSLRQCLPSSTSFFFFLFFSSWGLFIYLVLVKIPLLISQPHQLKKQQN